MNPGKEIFNLHLSKVENLLNEAKNQQNPALWLFENGLRTPMFMLEATARVYEKVYDSKDLEKRKEQIKTVEDAIGAVDHYNAYVKELALNAKIKPEIIAYLNQQTEKKLVELNKILEDENWLNGKRIDKIKETLNEIDWLSETEELSEIKKFYAKAITKIDEFIKITTFDFDHVEDDVHELRRRLRWLSIYPQALSGVFQYSKAEEKTDEHLQKYLTEEVLNSKFNIMPTSLSFEKPILINKNYFCSLSWIIAELGKLKDEGLRVFVLKEAIENTDNSNKEIDESEVYKILNQKQKSLEELLNEAEKIVKTFFEEKNLNSILV
jgi:hypothetical protein